MEWQTGDYISCQISDDVAGPRYCFKSLPVTSLTDIYVSSDIPIMNRLGVLKEKSPTWVEKKAKDLFRMVA
jgi:hypothetical protein